MKCVAAEAICAVLLCSLVAVTTAGSVGTLNRLRRSKTLYRLLLVETIGVWISPPFNCYVMHVRACVRAQAAGGQQIPEPFVHDIADGRALPNIHTPSISQLPRRLLSSFLHLPQPRLLQWSHSGGVLETLLQTVNHTMCRVLPTWMSSAPPALWMESHTIVRRDVTNVHTYLHLHYAELWVEFSWSIYCVYMIAILQC